MKHLRQCIDVARSPVGQVDSIRFKLEHQNIDELRDGDVSELRLCDGATDGHNAIVRTQIKLIDGRSR